MNRLPVLLTRPARGSAEFAEALRGALGEVEIIVNPLIEIVPVAPKELPGPDDALIFTSVSAVEVFATFQAGGGRRAWCVGDRTAAAAASAGFEPRVGNGVAAGLPERIAREQPVPLLLHMHGAHVRVDLAERLTSMGYPCHSVVIYDQPARALTPPLKARLAGGEAMVAPLFSPRSAGLLAAEVKNLGANLRVVALSSAVAQEWPGDAVVAERPDAAAMLDAVRREVG
ncbi:uroporphyrinogen-III synthase [Oceanicola sp. D3]|uniref:uroporphyrinogen-III synthase n=1 Tax=Oceanicola sp. D3 TaxID=2587163 RepID=UPI00143D025A|nr:uroporphyrinogen-III synthase [Oceanicola sp. D3]